MSPSVCVCVCLSVCLSVREHISGTTSAIFTNFSVLVAYGRGSALLRQCDEIQRVRRSVGGFLPRWQCIVTCSLQMGSTENGVMGGEVWSTIALYFAVRVIVLPIMDSLSDFRQLRYGTQTVRVTPLRRTLESSPLSKCASCLRCFDVVGWVAGRASGL